MLATPKMSFETDFVLAFLCIFNLYCIPAMSSTVPPKKICWILTPAPQSVILLRNGVIADVVS